MPEAVSTCNALEVLLSGLGEPSKTPPGCCKILLGCLDFIKSRPATESLNQHDRGRLNSALIRFITATRSEQNITQLALDLQVCRCYDLDAPAILSEASPVLHAHNEQICGNLTELLEEFSRHLINQLVIASKHTDSTTVTIDQFIRWPANNAELMPYGPDVTLHMLDAWSRHPSRTKTFIYLGALYPWIIKYFGPLLVPGLLKTHSGLSYVYSVIEDIMKFEQDRSVPRLPVLKVEYTLYLFVQIADILKTTSWLLSSDELLIWIDDGERDPEYHIFYSIVLLDYARQIVKNLPHEEHTSSMSSNLSAIEESIYAFTESVYTAVPSCIDITTLSYLDFRKFFSEIAHFKSSPFVRLLFSGYGGHRKGRCHGPSCLQTESDMGSRFKQCGGCHAAFYCSRRCQKRGWTYPGGSHRELCEISWKVHVCKAKAKDIKKQVEVVLDQYITHPEAEKAFTNVRTLFRSQFDAMRKWSFRCELFESQLKWTLAGELIQTPEYTIAEARESPSGINA
jgi:hypothetical protein